VKGRVSQFLNRYVIQDLRQFYFELNSILYVELKVLINTLCSIESMESNNDFQFGEGIVISDSFLNKINQEEIYRSDPGVQMSF